MSSIIINFWVWGSELMFPLQIWNSTEIMQSSATSKIENHPRYFVTPGPGQ